MRILIGVALAAFIIFFLVRCRRSDKASYPRSARGHFQVSFFGHKLRISELARLAEAWGGKVAVNGDLHTVSVAVGEKTLDISALVTDSVEEHARLAARTDMAVQIVDAAWGPLPVNREHVLIIRQMEIPEPAIIYFSNTQGIQQVKDSDELLELEELEMRELLNDYEFAGDDAACVYDRTGVPTTMGGVYMGPKAFLKCLNILVVNRSDRPAPPTPARRIAVSMYTLAEEEAPDVSTALSSGDTVRIVHEPGACDGDVICDRPVQPGENVKIQIALSAPIDTWPGKRLLVLREGHVIAVAVVAKIIE